MQGKLPQTINVNVNLREVGALPEHASREGCGVEVPDWCPAVARQLGRLVINGSHCLLASGDPPFWQRACGLYSQWRFLRFFCKFFVLV